jgi:hypothetical protein
MGPMIFLNRLGQPQNQSERIASFWGFFQGVWGILNSLFSGFSTRWVIGEKLEYSGQREFTDLDGDGWRIAAMISTVPSLPAHMKVESISSGAMIFGPLF